MFEESQSRFFTFIVSVSVIGLLLLGCTTSTYEVRIKKKDAEFTIIYQTQENQGMALEYDEKSEYLSGVRVLYCTPPKQDVWENKNSSAKALADVAGKVKAEISASFASESRKTSNHTKTSIMIDYAFYRVCELIVSGKVTADEADKLLGTLLGNAASTYKSLGFEDSKEEVEKAIDKYFNKKTP